MEDKKRIDLLLSEDELKQLAICKKHFQRVANATAIRDVIIAYPEALNLIQDLRAKLEVEKAKNSRMSIIIGDLKSAFRNLQEFK